jgi:integrase
MPKIEKLPSGSFRMRITIGTTKEGKVVRKSITATTRKELKAKASLYKVQHPSAPADLTFARAVDLYIESSEATLSPSTIRGYRSVARKLCGLPLASMPLNSITKTDVQQAIDQLSTQTADKTPPALKGIDTGKDYSNSRISPKSVRNAYGLITAVLTRYDIVIKGVRLPQKVRSVITVPGDDDMKQILAAAKGTALEVPIMLAAIGGMRRGEICALKIEDLEGNVIHVSKSMVKDKDGSWVVKPPKTFGSDRYVELPSYVADLIRSQGYIVRCTPSTLSDNHARFLDRHGLPHIRFHDYRHHMVSALHAAGVPDHYIMQRGGWSSDYTMKNVYRHTLADHESEAVQAAITHFEGLLGDA